MKSIKDPYTPPANIEAMSLASVEQKKTKSVSSQILSGSEEGGISPARESSLHPPAQEIRILIIDPSPIFRIGLQTVINSMRNQATLVGEASDDASISELIATLQPNMILMDLAEQRVSGVETIAKIKLSFPNIQIIVLSFEESLENIKGAFHAGANGYLPKSASASEMREAIFTVYVGGFVLTPLVAKGILTMVNNPVLPDEILSKRETQILEMISTGSTNKEIAKDLFLSIRTIEAQVHSIFRKLNAHSRTEAVTRAIGDHLIKQLPPRQS